MATTAFDEPFERVEIVATFKTTEVQHFSQSSQEYDALGRQIDKLFYVLRRLNEDKIENVEHE